MAQDGGNFANNYLNDLTSPSGQQGSQDGPPMPLPTTDTVSGDNNGQANTANQGSSSGSDNGSDSSGGSGPDFSQPGAKAAVHDFQVAAGEGWTYDPEAMKNQINRLKEIQDRELMKMDQHKDQVVDMLAPGSDDVSRQFNNVAKPSGASHNAQFERYKAYLTSYTETLEAIDKAYQEQDEEALQALRSKEV